MFTFKVKPLTHRIQVRVEGVICHKTVNRHLLSYMLDWISPLVTWILWSWFTLLSSVPLYVGMFQWSYQFSFSVREILKKLFKLVYYWNIKVYIRHWAYKCGCTFQNDSQDNINFKQYPATCENVNTYLMRLPFIVFPKTLNKYCAGFWLCTCISTFTALFTNQMLMMSQPNYLFQQLYSVLYGRTQTATALCYQQLYSDVYSCDSIYNVHNVNVKKYHTCKLFRYLKQLL